MRHIALILPAVFAAIPALAQQPGQPPKFETRRDAYQRQQADDYRARESSRSLLQNERATPLGDPRVYQAPNGNYASQPQPSYATGGHR